MSVEEIAAGLTKAQRDALLSATERVRDGGWICQNANRVKGPLLKLGLIYLAIPMFSWRSERRDVVLTPLGLRVAEYLRSK